MQQQSNQINNESGLFGYLLLLTTFFILLEISLFIQSSELYLGDYKLVADHLKIPGKIIPGILFFIFVQLLMHFFFTVFIWGMARLIAIPLKFSWSTTVKLGFSLWLCGIFTVLLANQYLFPNSKFAYLLGVLLSPRIGEVFLLLFSIVMCVGGILALVGFFIKMPKFVVVIASATLGSTLFYVNLPKSVILDGASAKKPNIILIGIDSMRPDFLGYFGYEKHTPHFDEFLNQATVFSDAFTPIARTFPAWVSILTGQYPKQSGVRFNLPTMEKFDWHNTLPNQLRQLGYETIFSTDETRFSNIDESFGFDKIITPPIGFNDFLLGNLNDFPFANLLVNTKLGKYLFPYSYGNRPVITTYDPDSFLNFLRPVLSSSRTKPLFLSIHFCLPHYPYYWSHYSANDKSIDNYKASIHRADQQFQDFLNLLAENKILEHSIVVLLSDHGEAIELSGDRVTEKEFFIPGKENKNGIVPHFYPKSFDFETVNQSAGHGTDVLGLTQSHIVLAFKTFGIEKNHIGSIAGVVSLLDIKPTILAFANAHPHPMEENSGQSLKKIVLGQSANTNFKRHFFMESDYSPHAIRSVHPETRKLLFEGIEFFQLDPKTARLTVKPNMAKLIVSSKQFADIYGDWILALYPQDKVNMMPILVNLNTGKWTNDLRTDFARTAPLEHMLKQMKLFFGNDITLILTSS